MLLDAIEKAARDPEYADAMTKAGSAVAYLDQSAFKNWYKKNSADNEIAVNVIGKVQQ